MLHGWKARIHHLTRNRSFLIRTSLIILVSGFVLGCVIQWLRVSSEGKSTSASKPSPLVSLSREAWRQIDQASEPAPRLLLRWLRRCLAQREDLSLDLGLSSPTAEGYLDDGHLFGHDLRTMITRHTTEGMERQLFSDFIIACLGDHDDKGRAALERLRQVAAQQPVVPFANEMLGHVCLERDLDDEALTAFMREGGLKEARSARESAFRLAISQKDADLLRDLMKQPLWAESASSWMRSRIGALTGDVWMQWKGLIEHQVETTRWGALLLTLFAGGIWYVIFTQHSPRESWRWLRPIAPVIAGVMSVWPTLILLAYQEYHLGMTEDAPFPQDLWYYLAGVGLREELSKLALVSIFMPYLVWRRQAGLALLASAFVGLGFAIEENIQYYTHGGGIAWSRFLTANFMHASMTGILGHALYEMLRTRFGHAEKFVTTFLAIVAAHGLYDYVSVSSLEISRLAGISIFSIVILALLAQRFFELLAETTNTSAGFISPAAVFLIGSSLLVATLFIVAGMTTDELSGIAAVGNECVGVAPVMFVYWRRFDVR